MVPTMILLGFAIGFLPRRWCLIGLVIVSVARPLLLFATSPSSTIDVQSRLGEMALAAANAGFGVLVVRRIVRPLGAIMRWLGSREQS